MRSIFGSQVDDSDFAPFSRENCSSFDLKSPRNMIGGFGVFEQASRLPLSLAWDAFGIKNGAATFDEMRSRVLDMCTVSFAEIIFLDVGSLLSPYFSRSWRGFRCLPPGPPTFKLEKCSTRTAQRGANCGIVYLNQG